MRKVLVFKETLLPLSETFIQGQVAALKSFHAVLAGLERSYPSLPVGDDAILLSEDGPLLSDLKAKLYRKTGIAPAFHRRAKALRPDLIHAHFANGGRTALPFARAVGAPLVVTLHGADITTEKRAGRYAALGREAELFLCVSEFIRQKAIEQGLPADKLRVHYIGTDLDLFRPVPEVRRGRLILFVGRLVEKKGCEFAIRAMKKVQAVDPGCRLRIAGDGPLRRSLERLAQQLKVDCDFLGFQPASVVRDEMQRARILCVPSVVAANGDSEGLGTVFIEAQAMGLPVVTSDHAGMREAVLDGITGLLSAERDPSGLAQSVLRLLTDDELWESYHRAAIEFVAERFDLKRQTRLLEEIYMEVVEHRGAKATALGP